MLDVHLIYFDEWDAEQDEAGWNLVNLGGAVACRYSSAAAACSGATRKGLPFILLSNEVTISEAIKVLEEFNAV